MIQDGNDFDKICKVLSTLKNENLKINNILIEKYKEMIEYRDFEQDSWSRTASGIYKIGHDCIRLKKLIYYYDRSYYESLYYYDMMASILTCLNEIFQQRILR